MKRYNRWNNIVGWAVFAVAALTYLATMEPSASLWDCSEFIATSYKLEVGHPPGAPLFMMMARLATMLAPSTEYVPLMVNAMNSLASAFCILFMFWTVTHLGRRIYSAPSARWPTPSPTPSGSRPTRAKSTPSRRCSRRSWCGSCSNGKTRPTNPMRRGG